MRGLNGGAEDPRADGLEAGGGEIGADSTTRRETRP